MSFPTFDSSVPTMPEQPALVVLPSSGSGNRLPLWLLALCGSFTAVATAISVMSMTLQLKNYRKPALQRAVVRIMVMVPLYAISSLIAIFSLEAAFFIDAIRDLYEAFVIYTFLQLLITYLGGERSLLIILHGRPPIPHPFPVNIFLRPMDVSDPWTLLNLKRGVLQYVQIKPLLVIATVILKATGTYREGRFAADSGYTYVSVVYNTSICLSLYCLAMFWVAVNNDLKPFRPIPKFLCVKGLLFLTFWQSIGISLLASTGIINHVGPYTDAEHMSLALVDSLICFQMPIFAIAHQYAFQASDYIDHSLNYAARLPFIYALRDAFGLKDVWEDTKDTIRGRGISYQAYEPAEGSLHHDIGRQKRIRAGLRYSRGGQAKYWIPIPGDDARHRGETGPLTSIKRKVDERLSAREGYAPLLPKQAHQVIGEDPDAPADANQHNGLFDSDSSDSDAPSLGFESLEDDEDNLYDRARRIGYAGFPNVDVSKEERRRRQWEEEDGILAGKWSRNGARSRGDSGAATPNERPAGQNKGKGKDKGKDKKAVYGAWADRSSPARQNGHAGPSTANGNDNGKGSAGHDESRQYDGDSERPDAWTNEHERGQDESSQMRWTKRQIRKGKHLVKTHLELPDNALGGKRDDGNARSPGSQSQPRSRAGSAPRTPLKSPLPPDAVDLVVEDSDALEEARARERRRGEPQTKAPTHIYRHNNPASPDGEVEVEEIYSPDIVDGDRRRSDAVEEGEQPNVEPDEMLARIEEATEGKTPWQTGPAPTSTRYDDEHNPWA